MLRGGFQAFNVENIDQPQVYYLNTDIQNKEMKPKTLYKGLELQKALWVHQI